MSIPLNTIYSYFETGDFPTQDQFQASWSSFWHKDQSIPSSKVTGLDEQLQNKADKNIFENHVSSPDSHANYLAKKDASNLQDANITAWKIALGVDELPENIATIDGGDKMGNVFTKHQSDTRFLSLNDFANDEGKILAEKIEALGLTTLIEVQETSLQGFVDNVAAYQFEDNDFIAIPDNHGNFNLYMFKGGEKAEAKNYLPTGITNITMAMVEGLQAALNSKMDKPSISSNFSYLASVKDGSVTWKPILMSPNYMVYWNGFEFMAANVGYQQGKVGIGTGSPSEQLDVMGRIRTDAVVLNINTEVRSNQLTCDGKKFFGTNISNIQRPLMYGDYEGELELWKNFTEDQRTNLKTMMNGGWTTGTMSVAMITPPVADQQNKNYWITLKGAGLNLPPTSFGLEIMGNDGQTPIAIIPNAQVQLFTTGTELSFYYNFKDLPVGHYKIRLWNGAAYYVTALTIKVIEKIQIVDFSGLTWTKKTFNNVANEGIFGKGGSAIYQSSPDVKAYNQSDPTIVGALKSSKINDIGENFYLEFSVNFQNPAGATETTQYVGLMNNASEVDLLDQTLTKIKIVGAINTYNGFRLVHLNNLTTGNNLNSWLSGSSETINVVVIKNNTTMTVAVTSRNITSLNVSTVPDIEYSLNMAVNNMGATTTTSMNIINLYKF